MHQNHAPMSNIKSVAPRSSPPVQGLTPEASAPASPLTSTWSSSENPTTLRRPRWTLGLELWHSLFGYIQARPIDSGSARG